jgi:hypothetical protein
MPLLADGGCAGEHLGALQEALQDFEVQLLRQASCHGGAVEVENSQAHNLIARFYVGLFVWYVSLTTSY